jgi:hypothetical protein
MGSFTVPRVPTLDVFQCRLLRVRSLFWETRDQVERCVNRLVMIYPAVPFLSNYS